MAVLPVQNVAVTGGTPAYVSANAGGDTFSGSGNERVEFINAGAAKTVNITAITPCSQGTLHNLVVSLADGTGTPVRKFIRRLAPSQYNNSSNMVAMTYSAVTGLTVGVFSES